MRKTNFAIPQNSHSVPTTSFHTFLQYCGS